MIPSFFIDFFTGKPSDDSGSNIIESPLSPTDSTSSEIHIVSPTESVTSSTSNTSTEVPRNSPKSPIVARGDKNSPDSNIPSPSPIRTFISKSFNEWADSPFARVKETTPNLEIHNLQDPFSNISPFNTPSPITINPTTPSPVDPSSSLAFDQSRAKVSVTTTKPEVDPTNVLLPESPISPSNPVDVQIPSSPNTSSTSSAPSKASHFLPVKQGGMEREFDRYFR